MAVKVFILGRPGSGKSTAVRRIAKLVQSDGWSPVCISDYDILHHLFQQEKNSLNNEPQNVIPTQYGGFDVINFSVLDTALRELEKKNRFRYSKNQKDELVVIIIDMRAETTSDLDPPQSKTYRALIPSNLKDFLFTLVALVYLLFAAIHFCITGDGSMLTCLLVAVAGFAGVKGIAGKINQGKDKTNH